jgi:hypothetical protein
VTARAFALALPALLGTLPGCGARARDERRPSPAVEAPLVAPATTSAASPAGSAPRTPFVSKDHPAKDREWPLTSAPQPVVEVVRGERRAFAAGDELKALYVTPIDVDEDGVPEHLVSAAGEFPSADTPLWVFAERGGRWASLGFLGAGYAVRKARGVGAAGFTPLCLFGHDGPVVIATEQIWRGTRYEASARYEPRPGGGRACEQEGVFVP